ncbi:hypothetical protein [Acinetobacter beijerinckii]|uniref:hypothetical protein n=1 Tax=Acinetobacter beijerinckii TaxID=262668 RepID=UPI0024058B92|nr:hypothetical protein [Acinetobacter beijerinckii]
MKIIFSILMLVLPAYANSATTPLQRFLLINDLESWLNGGESLINWTEFRKGRKITVYPNSYSLVKVYYDYRRNIFSAEKEYAGVILRTRMPFNSIEKNNRGEPIIVFDTGYGNNIYAVGLSIKEAEKVQVGAPLDLLCIGFKLGDYDNDMSATCSLFSNPSRFIAVNNIQHQEAQEAIEKILDGIKKLKELDKMLDNKKILDFNLECNSIDTTNYSSCSKMANSMLENIKLPKTTN